MNGHYETNGLYPLSVAPAEGYGTDPLTRTGEQILSHVSGRHIRVDNTDTGEFTLVEDRKEATKFENHDEACASALALLNKAKAKHAAKQLEAEAEHASIVS